MTGKFNKIITYMLLLAICLGLSTTGALANGNEMLGDPTLGIPPIAIASGTGIVANGTGLIIQPGTISLDVPLGTTVKQVLLYWEGQHKAPNGDDTIIVNGTEKTGFLIGGPTKFFQSWIPGSFFDVYSSTYRADITDLGLINAGLNTLTVDGLAFDFANNGAGIIVIYDDGVITSNIQLKDGNDLAYFQYPPPIDTTKEQEFTFTAATYDRKANITTFFSSVSGYTSGFNFRPSTINVTIGGITTPYIDQLNSNDGEEWDTLVIPVEIPAGVSSLKVQALSIDMQGRNDLINYGPASFAWNAIALSLPGIYVSPGSGKFNVSGYKINGTFNVNTSLPDWKISLINMTSGTEINTTTNSNGFYSFTGLANGTYNITEEMQTGWENMSEAYRHIEINGADVQHVNFTNKLKKSNPPSDSIDPVINNVTLNITTPFIGQNILVTVNSTDNIGVTSVTANGTSLFNQGGNIWNGTIIAQAGNHSVNVSASDSTGNIVWNNSTSYNASSFSQSQISSTTSSTDSSSCGRNVNTNEKYSNINQHEYSKEIDVYLSKSTISFSFKTLGIVTEAGFTPKTNEWCITALGEILKGRPSQATSDVPYQDATYFNVWIGPTGYSESSKVENQYLVFMKSDIKDGEIVKLMIYRDGAWIEARTEKLSESTYKAYTQGFGSFAIAKTLGPKTTTTPSVTASPVPGEPDKQEPVNLVLIIGVFLVILIGVIYYLKIR